MNFGGRGHFKVNTMQVASEITALVKAVEALKPRIILEIGTAWGGTLLLWASLASEKVLSCDLQDMTIKQSFFELFPPPGSGCKVVAISGDTHQAETKEKVSMQLQGKKVDFLFIDGDHTLSGVEADYNDYRSLVRSGGVIAFHDIVDHQSLPANQVQHFWKRLKKEMPCEEFIDDPKQCGFGIGIIRLPG